LLSTDILNTEFSNLNNNNVYRAIGGRADIHWSDPRNLYRFGGVFSQIGTGGGSTIILLLNPTTTDSPTMTNFDVQVNSSSYGTANGRVMYIMSINGTTKPYPFSWMAGFQLGIRAGFGILIFDPRFSMDFNKSSTVEENSTDVREYWRYNVHFGIGYKIGFINR
jgi:hypothetical protein